MSAARSSIKSADRSKTLFLQVVFSSWFNYWGLMNLLLLPIVEPGSERNDRLVQWGLCMMKRKSDAPSGYVQVKNLKLFTNRLQAVDQ